MTTLEGQEVTTVPVLLRGGLAGLYMVEHEMEGLGREMMSVRKSLAYLVLTLVTGISLLVLMTVYVLTTSVVYVVITTGCEITNVS